jgi:hypothetical protein
MMHECDDCKLGDKSPGKNDGHDTYTELTDLLRIAWEMERSATEGNHHFDKYVRDHSAVIQNIILKPEFICSICNQVIPAGEYRAPFFKSPFVEGSDKIAYTNIWVVHAKCRQETINKYAEDDWQKARWRIE